MGRSRPAPPLRTPDGARLTVTLRSGHVRPLERMAARTRSRASRTAASGRPTMVKPGSPLETWTSTETGRPTAPLSVAEATEASMSEGTVARVGADVPEMSPWDTLVGVCEVRDGVIAGWRDSFDPKGVRDPAIHRSTARG